MEKEVALLDEQLKFLSDGRFFFLLREERDPRRVSVALDEQL